MEDARARSASASRSTHRGALAGAEAKELTHLAAAADARFETIPLVLTGRALETRPAVSAATGGARADKLAVCRACYQAAARFRWLSGGHPILFDLEQLP